MNENLKFEEMEYSVEKWERTGLLDGCKDLSEKIRLSTILEDIANNLLKINEQTDEFQTKAGLMIPMAARIFYQGTDDITFDKLNSFLDKNLPDLKNYHTKCWSNIDGEMEFVSDYTDKYIDEVKNGI